MDNLDKLDISLFDAVAAFEKEHTATIFSQLRSVLIKYTFIGTELELCNKKRINSQDIEASHNFMKTLPASQARALEYSQQEIFETLNTTQDNQRKYRSVLKKFVDWLVTKGWLQEEVNTNNTEKAYRFSGEKNEKIQRKRLTRRKKAEPYTLSLNPSDYPDPEKAAVQLTRILSELEQLKEYLKDKNFKPYTIEMREKVTLEFLGWLYSKEDKKLEDLSLLSIVKFSKVQVSIKEFQDYPKSERYKKFDREKEIVKKRNVEAGKVTTKFLEKFLDEPKRPLRATTKEMYAETALTIGKFLYRNETDESEYRHCRDIPVVNMIRQIRNRYRNEAQTSPSAVPYKEKSVSWTETYIVLERSRREAIMTHTEYKIDGKVKRKKRPRQAIAASLMRFLILAMLVTVPPDRQRTYRELRIGETLKHGIWEENSFTPVKEMDDPTQAKFYIHLQPTDYKTGQVYGEWLAPLCNPEFSDGTKLYQYLEAWIYGCTPDNPLKTILNLDHEQPLRDDLSPKEHNHMFFGSMTKMPMSRSSFASVISHLFERMRGTPVRPQILRNMFRTYIDELGVTKEERISIAFWMKHSAQMAEKYSRQSCQRKLASAEELMERLNEDLLE